MNVAQFLLSTDRLLEVAAWGIYAFTLIFICRIFIHRFGRFSNVLKLNGSVLHARSVELRRAARHTLALKRENQSTTLQCQSLTEDSDKDDISVEELKKTRRAVFVLNETRRFEDKLYESVVSHKTRPVREPFLNHKRIYLVWAPDERRAHAKLSSHFKGDLGYEVGKVSERTMMPPSY